MPLVTCQHEPCAKTFPVIPSALARGRGRYCSLACKRAHARRECWRDPDWLRAYNAAYYATHHDHLCAQNRAYKKAHRAEHLAYNKAWNAAHLDRYTASKIASERAHPDGRRDITQRYRARKKNAPIIETIHRPLVYARDHWICQICFRPVDPQAKKGDGPSLDHVIPLSEGGNHTYQNVVLAHRRCNSRKQARPIPQQQRLFG